MSEERYHRLPDDYDNSALLLQDVQQQDVVRNTNNPELPQFARDLKKGCELLSQKYDSLQPPKACTEDRTSHLRVSVALGEFETSSKFLQSSLSSSGGSSYYSSSSSNDGASSVSLHYNGPEGISSIRSEHSLSSTESAVMFIISPKDANLDATILSHILTPLISLPPIQEGFNKMFGAGNWRHSVHPTVTSAGHRAITIMLAFQTEKLLENIIGDVSKVMDRLKLSPGPFFELAFSQSPSSATGNQDSSSAYGGGGYSSSSSSSDDNATKKLIKSKAKFELQLGRKFLQVFGLLMDEKNNSRRYAYSGEAAPPPETQPSPVFDFVTSFKNFNIDFDMEDLSEGLRKLFNDSLAGPADKDKLAFFNNWTELRKTFMLPVVCNALGVGDPDSWKWKYPYADGRTDNKGVDLDQVKAKFPPLYAQALDLLYNWHEISVVCGDHSLSLKFCEDKGTGFAVGALLLDPRNMEDFKTLVDSITNS